MTDEDLKDLLEHQNVVLDVRAILQTKYGKNFFKYIFKNLLVGEVPPQGSDGNMLFELLGFIRAGNSIFKLASEADVKTTALILAEVEKGKQDELYQQDNQ